MEHFDSFLRYTGDPAKNFTTVNGDHDRETTRMVGDCGSIITRAHSYSASISVAEISLEKSVYTSTTVTGLYTRELYVRVGALHLTDLGN